MDDFELLKKNKGGDHQPKVDGVTYPRWEKWWEKLCTDSIVATWREETSITSDRPGERKPSKVQFPKENFVYFRLMKF